MDKLTLRTLAIVVLTTVVIGTEPGWNNLDSEDVPKLKRYLLGMKIPDPQNPERHANFNIVFGIQNAMYQNVDLGRNYKADFVGNGWLSCETEFFVRQDSAHVTEIKKLTCLPILP